MEFKVEITDEYTKMSGKGVDLLAGLSLYVTALRKSNIAEEDILFSFLLGMKEDLDIDNGANINRKQFKGKSKSELDKFIKDNIRDIFN